MGSLGRYAVSALLPHVPGGFPWATLLVNISGALAMGMLVGWLALRSRKHALLRPFLGVGVLGGWTTFSAFAVDVVQLSDTGHAGMAVAYVVATMAASTAAIALGLFVIRRRSTQ